MSGKLPILKLFLYPALGMFAYSAYCHYSQQYEKAYKKQQMPVKYMLELYQALQNTKDVKETAQVYMLMTRYLQKFVTDPSFSNEKISNTEITKPNETTNQKWFSAYKIVRDFYVNNFNSRKWKKTGSFSVGLWLEPYETNYLSINNVDRVASFGKAAVIEQQQKCISLAKSLEEAKETGFLQTFTECMNLTRIPISKLSRQVELIDSIKEYQIN